MSVITVENLTKDYGAGRGVFDINLNIEQGEMVGFAGTNGSGKTTTIRNMLGFIKPTSGRASVNGLTSWEHSGEIAKSIGYVPGEIAFPDLPTGVDFFNCQAEFLGMTDRKKANNLIERLQLDPRADLKRMSKGMKQKTALVAALMNDAPIIILDEPTTGLDPLMRQSFLDIIKEEHSRGKTVFMSSHMFDELEATCDRVALINDGHIVDIAAMEDIKNRPVKQMKIEFKKHDDYNRFLKEPFKAVRLQPQYYQVTVDLPREKNAVLLKTLTDYDLKFVSEVPYTLEKHFKEVLAKNKNAQAN